MSSSSVSGAAGAACDGIELANKRLSDALDSLSGHQIANISPVRLWTGVLGGLALISTFALWDVGVFQSGQTTTVAKTDPPPGVSRGQGRLPGFVDNWWTSSYFLCSSNIEYDIADAIVPALYELGFTPNGVVFLNGFVRIFLLHQFYNCRYLRILVLLLIIQVLDAADGQMARAYSMSSAWGHSLDHVTDEIFTAAFMVLTLYLMSGKCGRTSWAVINTSVLFICMLVLGASYMHALNDATHQEPHLLALLGMYQMLHMSYIQIVLVLTAWLSGSMPEPSEPNSLKCLPTSLRHIV